MNEKRAAQTRVTLNERGECGGWQEICAVLKFSNLDKDINTNIIIAFKYSNREYPYNTQSFIHAEP